MPVANSLPAPLYSRVADRIQELIAAGTLRPGDRIPSVRKLASQMSVSVSTVLEAYRRLEDRGVIEARPQSGHYVRPPLDLPPVPERTVSCRFSAELSIAETVVRVLDQVGRTDIVPFGCATPAPEFLPTAQLNRILARVVRNDPNVASSYEAIAGHAALRAQVARRAMEAGCTLTPDDVVVTDGAQEAVLIGLRAVTRPGDTVAIETPTYWGLLETLHALGLRAVEIATDPLEGICPIDLAAAIEREPIAAVVLQPSFGNPLGQNMPAEARRRIVDLLAEHEIPLIEDDVYGELGHEGARPRACKAYDTEGGVLLCSSFSKTLAPGYRIGWIAPGRFVNAARRLKLAHNVATATPLQMAVTAYLESGGFDRHLRRLRRTYRDLVTRFAAAVGEAFPDGTRVSRPTGGHVLWVEMPEGYDALALHERALAAGIGTMPGPAMSASGRFVNCLRVNCAVPWSERTAAAIETLGHLAHTRD